MYAVIKAGAHQYKVEEGDVLAIDRAAGDAGETITFDQVLMVGGAKTVIGAPLVSGATVEATIAEQKLGRKTLIVKYKRRKNYRRTRGHRQHITVVKINKIKA